MTGRALDADCIIEPVRGPLIPGFAAVKKAAKDAGDMQVTLQHTHSREGNAPTGLAYCAHWLGCHTLNFCDLVRTSLCCKLVPFYPQQCHGRLTLCRL